VRTEHDEEKEKSNSDFSFFASFKKKVNQFLGNTAAKQKTQSLGANARSFVRRPQRDVFSCLDECYLVDPASHIRLS